MTAGVEVETTDGVVFVFISRLYQTRLCAGGLPSHLIWLGGVPFINEKTKIGE
jgi:hypothetical protein